VKLEIPNHDFFTNTDEMAKYVINLLENETTKYPDVIFSQLTLFFKDYNSENSFFTTIKDLILDTYPNKGFVTLLSTGNQNFCSDERVKEYIITSSNIEKIIDLLSHFSDFPRPDSVNGWNGLIILRMVQDPAVALYVSSYARCRNLFLITTILDENRDNEVVISPGECWL